MIALTSISDLRPMLLQTWFFEPRNILTVVGLQLDMTIRVGTKTILLVITETRVMTYPNKTESITSFLVTL